VNRFARRASLMTYDDWELTLTLMPVTLVTDGIKSFFPFVTSTNSRSLDPSLTQIGRITVLAHRGLSQIYLYSKGKMGVPRAGRLGYRRRLLRRLFRFFLVSFVLWIVLGIVWLLLPSPLPYSLLTSSPSRSTYPPPSQDESHSEPAKSTYATHVLRQAQFDELLTVVMIPYKILLPLL
jgi:hypothetical protein